MCQLMVTFELAGRAGWPATYHNTVLGETVTLIERRLMAASLLHLGARQVCDFSNPNAFETCKTGSCEYGLLLIEPNLTSN